MPVETVGENVRVRVRQASEFEKGSLRTITLSAKQGIKAVVGRPKGSKTTAIQSYMFDKKQWSEAEAEKWVSEHKKNAEADVLRIERKELSLIDRLTTTFKSWLEGNVIVSEPEPQPEPLVNSFMVWKEAGRYRWLAVFSNRFRDNDRPPEILSSAAHKDFVKAVDSGEWPMPQLWHWHTPGTTWGQADWLAYDEEKGFVLASGWVSDGHEKEAETLAAMKTFIGVSHGMVGKSIERDETDPSIITQYRTFEISDLPAWAAANPLTGFSIYPQEAKNMSIPKEKRDYLQTVGLTGEQIDGIEAQVGDLSKEAEEAGLEFKETPAEVIATEEQVEAADEPEATPEVVEAETLTKEEVADAIMTATLPLQQMVEALQVKLDTLSQADEAKIADKAAATPAMSLSELVGARMRAVGSSEAQIDGRTALSRLAPEETAPNKEGLHGIPFISKMLAGS